MPRRDWINLIRSLAPQYGIDPQAALAVAAQEGLSGGVGDQGTSFGPFQLHVGGALPSGRGRSWAESPEGIRYALQQMSKVARGKGGADAVRAIVSGFERPANPGREIGNAINALASFRPGPHGGTTASGTSPTLPGPRAPTPSSAPRQNEVLRALTGKGDIGDFIQSFTKATRPTNPRAPVEVQRGASRPIHGKIIGTPHKGTHTLGNWESDNAVDVAMPVGTPIYAPVGGTIGKQFGQMGAKGSRFEGIRMHLLSPQDELYLAHLSRVAKGIGPGVHVNAGQLLGYSGSASGVGHLHLGSRDDRAASYVS